MGDFRPLGPLGKIALVAEILRDYVPMWRLLSHPNLVEMAHAARDVHPGTARGPAELEHRTALRLGRAVSRTLRLLPTDSRCLIRSLVLTRVMARRSIPGTIVIGVTRSPEFEAHAWVEHGGEPILPAGEFTRLTEV